MEKTIPQLPSSSSSSEEEVTSRVFNSQVEQPGVTHIWNDAQLPFTGPVPGRPQLNFCQHGELPEVLPQLDQKRKLMLMQLQTQMMQMRSLQQPQQLQQLPYFGLSGVTGPVPGRPQLNFCQQQRLKELRLHLNSHASKQPGAAAPITPNEAHIDDGVISKKRSQERLSQVGELAAGSRTNRMRYTHSAEAQVQPGMQQQRFSQILEEFNTKFEEGMIKMEERMTKFEERMAIVPQLVDRISELEKNLENLVSIRSKDTGNTTTLMEGKFANLTIGDIKTEEGSTSEQEGYTCGEDFVFLSEE